jgi:hypothetical protein
VLGSARNSDAAGERLPIYEGDYRVASAIHPFTTVPGQTSNKFIKPVLCKVVKLLRKRADGGREGLGAAFRQTGMGVR